MHLTIRRAMGRLCERSTSLSIAAIPLLLQPTSDPSTWVRPSETVWSYLVDHWSQIYQKTLEHIEMVAIATVIAIVIGVAIGIYITYHESLARVVLYITGIVMTVPSIALFGLLLIVLSRLDKVVEPLGINIPALGLLPSVIALILYSQLPIVRNVYTAFTQIDPHLLEAGTGMGMSTRQLFFKVKFPMAVPVMMAGIRNAVIITIGIGALATYIGGGGMGDIIDRGIGQSRPSMILAGALAVSVLALIAEAFFAIVQTLLTPKGLRIQERR